MCSMARCVSKRAFAAVQPWRAYPVVGRQPLVHVFLDRKPNWFMTK